MSDKIVTEVPIGNYGENIRVEIDAENKRVKVIGAATVHAMFDLRREEMRRSSDKLLEPDMFEVTSKQDYSGDLEISVFREKGRWWRLFASPMIKIWRSGWYMGVHPKVNVVYSVGGKEDAHVEEIDETIPHAVVPEIGEQPLLPMQFSAQPESATERLI